MAKRLLMLMCLIIAENVSASTTMELTENGNEQRTCSLETHDISSFVRCEIDKGQFGSSPIFQEWQRDAEARRKTRKPKTPYEILECVDPENQARKGWFGLFSSKNTEPSSDVLSYDGEKQSRAKTLLLLSMFSDSNSNSQAFLLFFEACLINLNRPNSLIRWSDCSQNIKDLYKKISTEKDKQNQFSNMFDQSTTIQLKNNSLDYFFALLQQTHLRDFFHTQSSLIRALVLFKVEHQQTVWVSDKNPHLMRLFFQRLSDRKAQDEFVEGWWSLTQGKFSDSDLGEFNRLFILMNGPSFIDTLSRKDVQDLLRELLRVNNPTVTQEVVNEARNPLIAGGGARLMPTVYPAVDSTRMLTMVSSANGGAPNSPAGSLLNFTDDETKSVVSHRSVESRYSLVGSTFLHNFQQEDLDPVPLTGNIPFAAGESNHFQFLSEVQYGVAVPELEYQGQRISLFPCNIEQLGLFRENMKSSIGISAAQQSNVIAFISNHLEFLSGFRNYIKPLKQEYHSKIKKSGDFFSSNASRVTQSQNLKTLYDSVKGEINSYKDTRSSFKDLKTVFKTLYEGYGKYLKGLGRESFLEGMNVSIVLNASLHLEELAKLLQDFRTITEVPSIIDENDVVLVRKLGAENSLTYMESIARFFMEKIAYELTQTESVQNSLPAIINMMRDLEIRGTLDTRGRNLRTLILKTNGDASTSPIQMARVDGVIERIEANAADVITIIKKNP